MANEGQTNNPTGLTAAQLLLRLTGAATLAAGAMLYGDGDASLATLAAGAANTVLTHTGTVPAWSTSLALTSTIASKQAAQAGVSLDHNSATGNFTMRLSPANLTANRRATFGDADFAFTGGGTLALGTFTLTVPATGTAALLGTANVFTALQTVGYSSAIFAVGNGVGSPEHRINGAAGNARQLTYYTNGSIRWNFQCTSAAESGANAGSPFALSAYTDAGAYIDDPFNIARAAGGTFSIFRPVLISSNNLTVGANLIVSGATDSSSKDVGSIVTEGGIGAEKSIMIGGSYSVTAAGARYNFNVSGAYLSWIECDGAAGANYMRFGVANTEWLRIDQAGLITLANAVNIAVNTSTGTKIGTATTQKLSLWNATPIVQPASANQAALTNSTGGTYDGTLAAISGTGADAAINNNFTDLWTLLDAMRTAMVNFGSMKGAA